LANSYKIIICEDHDVVVEGVKLMLANQNQFVLCGHVRTQPELFGLLQKEKPHVLLLDLNLKREDGFALLEQLRPIFPA
jgi:DNA-binding NarL/FixJ family response regulator